MTVPVRYTRIAIALHWLLAVLILGNILLAWSIDSFDEGSQRAAIDFHKSVGLTVLGLALLRLLWRATHPAPELDAEASPWERRLAQFVHWGFYALIFAIPLTGWIHDSAWKGAPTHKLTIFGLPWFRIGPIEALDPATKEQVHAQVFAVHGFLSNALLALLALHVAGALKHQFIDRRPELQRMLPGGRAR